MNKIKKFLKAMDCSAVFIAKNSDNAFAYFTELPLQWFDGASLVLKKGKKPLIICSSLEYKWIKGKKGFRVKQVKEKEDFKQILKKELTAKKIGVNKAGFCCKALGKLKRILGKKKVISIDKEIGKAMEIKSKQEIELIRKACSITTNALKKVPKLVKKGISEKELALALEFEMRKQGAEGIAFPLICASGKNAGIPHFIPSGKKIGKGFLLVDLGARYKNYCADVSRTFFVGKASEKEKEIYASVLKAKKKAEELLKGKKKAEKLLEGKKHAGNLLREKRNKEKMLLEKEVSAKKVYLAAEEELKKAGFKLVHALGHGVGINSHDFPRRINEKANFKLLEGMVFTLEPGIYDSRMGIRIEDTYLKTRKGFEKLSRFPEELAEI